MISFSEILFRLAATLILGAVVGFEGEQKVQETISRVISELHSLLGMNGIHASLRSPDPEIPFRELAICYTHRKDNYSARVSKGPTWPLGGVRGRASGGCNSGYPPSFSTPRRRRRLKRKKA